MSPPKDPVTFEEYRKRMVAASRKVWDTPELREKLISSMKKKKLSEDHKEKLRIAGFKQTTTDQKREKCRLNNLGKPKSKEHREKLSVAKTGQKPSEETIAKYRIRKQQLATDPDYLRHNSESVILAKNEIWYGGVKYFEDNLYCELWTAELRERCRAFFGYLCFECGTPQGKRKLGVHHVHYNKKTCCDGSPRDIVPLCQECHGKTTSGDRKYWEQHFTEMLYGYYGGKCFFTKEEMKAYKGR